MDSNSSKKDFFISYTSADKRWAQWIAWCLEDAKYTTIIQEWDFLPGSNFVADMHKASSQTRCTLAVLSPEYLDSCYTKPEWTAAFAQDPDGQKGLLIPVRVRNCEMSGLLSQIVYIDLVAQDENTALQTLLNGVQRSRAKPKEAPTYPAGSSAKPPTFPVENVERAHLQNQTISNSERAKSIPEAHTMDREPQELQLEKIIDEHLTSSFSSPLLCIFYGHSNQAPYTYTNRIVKSSLSEQLTKPRSPQKYSQPQWVPVSWIHHTDKRYYDKRFLLEKLRTDSIDELEKRLQNVQLNNSLWPENLFQYATNTPLAFLYQIKWNSLKSAGLKLLEDWIQEWTRFNDERAKLIFVFFEIEYGDYDHHRVFRFFRQSPAEHPIHRHLDKWMNKYGRNRSLSLLPKLENVSFPEIEKWISDHITSSININIQMALRSYLSGAWPEFDSKGIPMHVYIHQGFHSNIINIAANEARQ